MRALNKSFDTMKTKNLTTFYWSYWEGQLLRYMFLFWTFPNDKRLLEWNCPVPNGSGPQLHFRIVKVDFQHPSIHDLAF